MRKDGSRGYNAKMLAVSEEGKLLWQFPKNEVIDSWITGAMSTTKTAEQYFRHLLTISARI